VFGVAPAIVQWAPLCGLRLGQNASLTLNNNNNIVMWKIRKFSPVGTRTHDYKHDRRSPYQLNHRGWLLISLMKTVRRYRPHLSRYFYTISGHLKFFSKKTKEFLRTKCKWSIVYRVSIWSCNWQKTVVGISFPWIPPW